MDKLKFKSFTWPQNPTTYNQKVIRMPVFEELSTGTTEFTGLSGARRTISGTGVFTGSDAIKNYQALETLATKFAPGNFVHPLLGTYYCYLIEVEMTQEPQENLVSYRFTLLWADENGDVPY